MAIPLPNQSLREVAKRRMAAAAAEIAERQRLEEEAARLQFRGPKGDPGEPGERGLRGETGGRGNDGVDGVDGTLEPLLVLANDNYPAFIPISAGGLNADSANPSSFLNRLVGITLEPATNGAMVSVAAQGRDVTNNSWSWVSGDVIYLNGTTLSTTPPDTGFLQRIGIAVASNKILVDIAIPILL